MDLARKLNPSSSSPEEALDGLRDCAVYAHDEPNQQLNLFGFSPWSQTSYVCLVRSPCKGVACAVLAPVFSAYDQPSAYDQRIHCLLISEDGWHISVADISHEQLFHDDVWPRLSNGLLHSPDSCAAVDPSCYEIANDCFSSILNPAKWHLTVDDKTARRTAVTSFAKMLAGQIRASGVDVKSTDMPKLELQASATLIQRMEVAVRLAMLSALAPEIEKLLAERPALGLSQARNLLDLARPYGAEALRNAIQALRTESLGLLNLIVSASDNRVVRLRNALFSGLSFPSVLAEQFGISRSAHRCSLRRVHERTTVSHGLADRALDGFAWVTVLRLLSAGLERLPQTERGDWNRFIELALCADLLDLESKKRMRDLACWCWRVQDSAARCKYLLTTARRVQDTAERWGTPRPSLGTVVDVLLAIFRSDEYRFFAHGGEECVPFGIAHSLQALSVLTGICMADLTSDIFAACPLMTTGTGPVRLRQLCSLTEVVEFGKGRMCCLGSEGTATNYAARGPLFELTDSRGMFGTLALVVKPSPECAAELSIYEIDHFAPEDLALIAAIKELCRITSGSPQWVAYSMRLTAWRAKMGLVAC
jgi:hypothetical protein